MKQRQRRTVQMNEGSVDEQQQPLVTCDAPVVAERDPVVDTVQRQRDKCGASRVLAVTVSYFVIPSLLFVVVFLAAEISVAASSGDEKPPRGLAWFDVVFRSWMGPLLPFIAAALCLISPVTRRDIFVFIASLAAVRLVVYLLLRLITTQALMSDHAFFALSLSASAQTVLYVSRSSSSSLLQAESMPSRSVWSTHARVCRIMGEAMCIVLILLLVANTYITFRYYHNASEVRDLLNGTHTHTHTHTHAERERERAHRECRIMMHHEVMMNSSSSRV